MSRPLKSGFTYVFQPALPMRGVTFIIGIYARGKKFQPALPMRGVTLSAAVVGTGIVFQPALPMRGVTYRLFISKPEFLISTRTPHAGSDRTCPPHPRGRSRISTRTPHAGSDRRPVRRAGHQHISTRTPHAGSDSAQWFNGEGLY